MKSIIGILFLTLVGTVYAEEQPFLNIAILELPDRYVADVPLAKRAAWLSQLSRTTRHLDYAHGWLRHFGDGEGQGATSQLWMKILPRKKKDPLVFVHMAKPFANGEKPMKNQSFVLERRGNDWIDVTGTVVPGEVDLTMHFRPRRSTSVIDVCPWKRFEIKNARHGYTWGQPQLYLLWKDGEFKIANPEELPQSPTK